MRILIADDDAYARSYFVRAFQEFGCACFGATDGHHALSASEPGQFDLALCDVRMPGPGPWDLPALLRARDPALRLVATTAGLDADLRARLLAAGWQAVLAKPVPLDVLREFAVPARGSTMSMHAGEDRPSAPPGIELADSTALLDDAAALVALGTQDTLRAMRGLSLAELDRASADLSPGSGLDPGALRECLHRLEATCAICGLSGLGAAVRHLQSASGDEQPQARLEVLATVHATRAAVAAWWATAPLGDPPS